MKAVLLAPLFAFMAHVCFAQARPPLVFSDTVYRPRFVVVDDYIRDELAADWDAHANDPIKMERAYCLGWQYDIWASEVAYRVTQIMPATKIKASVDEIYFECPKGTRVAEIHIHPNQTCVDGVCWDGGPYSHQCLPSDADRAYLNWAKQPFGMVQCSRDATVFYFPLGDNR